ncbi:RNA polymerase sporulation-specific sigma factor [Alkalithermobacter thermoalcaliphilus JW-YL-7 = DSM 7308]|uniref:RNA polymerase sigma factor n=2 Tax=Clostridium paradoxum TaxID=29346 RepID=A0A150FQA4_CLOPD|nr:RNA polymerase, sigma 28 subunit, SigF [[Clostridium] paradoxum JW-YL-7 = DSM 7308]SHK53724.1 RNA polymerase sporulation-specific sigma factor [[Clostridium] paradoxum JW-YL-7 = DSM 7308]
MVMAAQKEEKNVLLSHEETIELIKRAQNGDNMAKEILTESNLGLVRSIVNKFLNIGYERDDLFQLGCIGLIKAIYKFNDDYNVKFSTYAVPMILGEIKRHLRDDGIIKVSRSLKQINSKVKAQSEILSKKLGREPTIQEISDVLGVSKEDIVMALESNSCVDYLYDVIHDEGGSPVCLIDKISQDKQESDNKIVDNILLKEVLNKLDKRERQIIILRYFEDRTQSEIGKMLGISQVQVSRIEKKVLEKIRKLIE